MKVIAKKNRELALINAQNTQNENIAETITLVVPEEYEDYNKKIVFVTDDGTAWDIITNNEYKITNAITKYKQVDFYIWLTKDDVDFRTKTKTLNFYHNEDASDEITDEEIHGVNTVVNLLEEEIEKVENLNIEATKIGNTTTVTITKKDGTTESVEINDGTDGQDGQDGYTPQKGIDYFTEQDIEEIEGDILNEVYTKSETDTLLEGKADVEDIPDVSSFITKDVNNLTYYTLKTNTGSLIDLEINDTTYVVTLKLKNQDGTIISTDTIDLPLESVVVSGRYDNTTKKVILTLENGSEVDFSVADLVAGLQSEITSTNKLPSDLVDDTNSGNKFVTTTEKQTWNNKLDESDLTDYVKNDDYAKSDEGGTIKATNGAGIYVSSSGALYANERTYSQYKRDSLNEFISKGTLENVIEGKQLINQTQLEESQATQDNDIEALQTENARLKATLPTTTGEGQAITLDKTAELEFIKPPLPMGNSEQESTTGRNLLPTPEVKSQTLNGVTVSRFEDGTITIKGTPTAQMDVKFNFEESTFSAGSYIHFRNNFSTYNFAVSFRKDGVNKIAPGLAPLNNIYQIPEDITVNQMVVLCNNDAVGTAYDITLKPSIELTNEVTEYEKYTNGASPNPDYQQEITNVTGDVEVVVENKNLLNYNLEAEHYFYNANGIRTYDENNFYINQQINTNSLNKLVFSSSSQYGSSSIRICEFNNENTFISRKLIGSTSGVVDLNSQTNYIIVSINKSNDSYYVNPQLEKGTTSTPYTPHQEQVLPLTLGNIELCKIGDYQDYFYKESNKWYLHKEIGKVVFNGSENWNYNAQQKVAYLQLLTKVSSRKGLFSNLFSYYNAGWATAPNNTISEETSSNFIFIKSTVASDNTAWKTWLSNNNTEVYYPLITPTDTEITDTTLISQLEAINNALSHEEQTNISSNTIALFNVEAYQSTKLVLEENNAKYESLEARVALLE